MYPNPERKFEAIEAGCARPFTQQLPVCFAPTLGPTPLLRLRTVRCLALVLALSIVAVAFAFSRASASIFLATLGFEDDVDLVVDPFGEFLVVPEEREDGSEARVRLIDLDPATGQPIAPFAPIPMIGFENAVDPMIVRAPGAAHALVLVPTESENGDRAELHILEVTNAAVLVGHEIIDLGDLGFRPDVDGTWTQYPSAIAFYSLENKDATVRGVLAVDVDASAPDFDYGECSLLSTDGRLLCDENVEVDWLPGLADGVDPGSFNTGFSARLVLPVSSDDGSDLLLIDFDPSDGIADHPEYMSYTSVKEVNADGARPTPFPGWVRDVDPLVFTSLPPAPCFGDNAILVPVEDPSGDGDLYLLNSDGSARFILSVDGAPLPGPILGFEQGVDVVTMCGLPFGPPNRLAVPLENSDGTDADVWILDLDTFDVLAGAEDTNPGLTITGFEIGIEPFRWTPGHLLIPMEDTDGLGGLVVLNPDGVIQSIQLFTAYGFVRSVDPILAPVPGPPLYVPVMTVDGSEADVLYYAAPPFLASDSVEDLNPGLEFGSFEWDVDLGSTDKTAPGGAWIYLPEEDEFGVGRVRFETVVSQGSVTVVVANKSLGATPSALRFFNGPDADLLAEFEDVAGLEPGLDLANGRGPIRIANPPGNLISGQDADTDPTLAWITEATSEVPLPEASAPEVRMLHANPFRAPGLLRLTLEETASVRLQVLDTAGRSVGTLFDGTLRPGEHGIFWDGRDGRGEELPTGVYFLALRGPWGASSSRVVLIK